VLGKVNAAEPLDEAPERYWLVKYDPVLGCDQGRDEDVEVTVGSLFGDRAQELTLPADELGEVVPSG
jgi:hypothetical protein